MGQSREELLSCTKIDTEVGSAIGRTTEIGKGDREGNSSPLEQEDGGREWRGALELDRLSQRGADGSGEIESGKAQCIAPVAGWGAASNDQNCLVVCKEKCRFWM
ncbi:unnamed protein product [Calypogeia fissa]